MHAGTLCGVTTLTVEKLLPGEERRDRNKDRDRDWD